MYLCTKANCKKKFRFLINEDIIKFLVVRNFVELIVASDMRHLAFTIMERILQYSAKGFLFQFIKFGKYCYKKRFFQ